jgi:hypothetical protein
MGELQLDGLRLRAGRADAERQCGRKDADLAGLTHTHGNPPISFLDGIFPSWVCVEKAFLRNRMRHLDGLAAETVSQLRRPQ